MARTNVNLDDNLVAAGMKMTGCKTKREVVNLALKELVARKERKKILKLEGNLLWVGSLDEMRKSRV
ncbi:MAG: type II toxin-antitoxin system VapB family antitoxin [Nitrospirae bacterium]|nr:type II toxin-antitoxin system VapB family antitoxin [Candidatus Troglogloeales bacterium]